MILINIADIRARPKQVGGWQQEKIDSEFSKLFFDFLHGLEQGGLILEGQDNIRQEGLYFLCRVIAQDAEALAGKNYNYHTRKSLAGLAEAADAPPEVIDLGPLLVPKGCGCKKSPYLILFPCAEWEGSPIRCGGCGGSFPLYRAKKVALDREFGEFFSWRKLYRGYVLHYTSSFDSGNHWDEPRSKLRPQVPQQDRGEPGHILPDHILIKKRDAYDMLHSCVSPLSLFGRRLAGSVEEETGILTYYPLYQQYENIPAACPQCGANWVNPYPDAIRFSHVCPGCRICMGALD